jgi:hypothetical protein
MRKPAEKNLDWHTYLYLFLSAERINAWVRFWIENR